MKKSLTRSERLRKRKELERVFASGQRTSGFGLKLLFVKNDFTWNRIAFTLSKKYGNAVTRNRAKRVVREIYRNNKRLLKQGYDMILIVYPGKDDYSSRKDAVLKLFSKAKLIT